MGSSSAASRIAIGYVAGVHGVRGEIVGRTDDGSDLLSELTSIYIGDVHHQVEQARFTPKGVLLRLAGVSDRTAAEALRGHTIAADREDLVEEEGDVLLQEMIGCRVISSDGVPFGEVAQIQWGLQDRLVVLDAEFERLIPVVDELILGVDLERNEIVVACDADWPKSPRSP